MEAFKVNGKGIHFLEARRENLDIRQVVAISLDGSFAHWLADCFYEKQSEQVRALYPIGNRQSGKTGTAVPVKWKLRCCDGHFISP